MVTTKAFGPIFVIGHAVKGAYPGEPPAFRHETLLHNLQAVDAILLLFEGKFITC